MQTALPKISSPNCERRPSKKSMLSLCRDLKLSIQWIHKHQLRLTLANDLSLDQIEVALEVNDPPMGGSRSYENREAIIIGMRRLVNQALKAGLISGSPGTSQTLNAGGVDVPMTFTTDEEF
jgi:hypothetical protein